MTSSLFTQRTPANGHDTNVASGVLVKVDEPTDWVHNLVIIEKKNGLLRLCLDPRHKREHYTKLQ